MYGSFPRTSVVETFQHSRVTLQRPSGHPVGRRCSSLDLPSSTATDGGMRSFPASVAAPTYGLRFTGSMLLYRESGANIYMGLVVMATY